MGTDGSVAYLFERKGQLFYEAGVDEEALMDAALEAGAEDVISNDDGSAEVMTEWTEFMTVKEALEAAGMTPAGGEVAMIASTQAEMDVDGAEKIMKLVDRLEDLDDVQNVYTNADISAEVMEQIG